MFRLLLWASFCQGSVMWQRKRIEILSKNIGTKECDIISTYIQMKVKQN